MESEELEIGLLKYYKASIHLKEDYHPRYIQARRLTIYILPIVVLKFKKWFSRVFLKRSLMGEAIGRHQ